MINNQKNASSKVAGIFGTPLRKGLAIGATSVVAATGLLAVGATSATASTVPAPVATHSASTVHGHHGARSLLQQLRADLFSTTIDGAKAQAFATRISGDTAIFSKLPASLQTALTGLKNAPASDAAADAQQIKATALDGGYGAQIESLAKALDNSAKFPTVRSLIGELPWGVGATAHKFVGVPAGGWSAGTHAAGTPSAGVHAGTSVHVTSHGWKN